MSSINLNISFTFDLAALADHENFGHLDGEQISTDDVYNQILAQIHSEVLYGYGDTVQMEVSKQPIYGVDEKAFKASSERLSEYLMARRDKEPKPRFCLNALSQAVHSIPYEALKATKFDVQGTQPPVTKNQEDLVVLVDVNGGDTMLFVEGEFIYSTYSGTDMYTPINALQKMAEQEAARLDTFVEEKSFCGELGNEWEYDDLALAFRALGLISDGKPNIFQEMDGASGFVIDGHILCKYGLNGDWKSEFEADEYDLATTAWNPEATDDDFQCYEWFVSVGDLLKAHKSSDGTWYIPYSQQDGYDMEVTLLK